MAISVTRGEPLAISSSLASCRPKVHATMMIRRRVWMLRRVWILRCVSLGALALSACVADADPLAAPPAGSSGAGSTAVAGAGSAGAGGASAQSPVASNGGSAGGASEYTSDSSFGAGKPCPPIQQALLTDFTPPPAADPGVDAGPPMGASFGDFSTTFSGSTFVYPTDGAYAVHPDASGNNWHLTGTLGNYSGFGITFNGCFLLDASDYKGIAFTVQGSVPMGNSITFNVGTAADDITAVWLNRNAMPPPNPTLVPNAGRCVPAMSQYDGSCASPSHAVPVTAQPTTIQVLWADLAGGRPAASVDPKEITNISWNFPPPAGAGTSTPVTYDVDLTIDDLRFIE